MNIKMERIQKAKPALDRPVRSRLLFNLCLLLLIYLIHSCSSKTKDALNPEAVKAPVPPGYTSNIAKVNGVNIHYVIGGKGKPVFLIHGFGQNWYMWNRIMPDLAKKYTVVAPDLRGVGESDKPDSGYNKVTLATDIHELAKKLGFNKVSIAGHDIGLMVACAYAGKFQSEVNKVVLMDAIIPGVEPEWTQITTTSWWFSFQAQPNSERSIQGNERNYLTNLLAGSRL